MAGKKPKKAKSVWSAAGKSVEELLKLGSDYNRYRRLTEPTLRKVVNRLASAANKRLRRMENAGEASPAYKEVQASGGKFSTAGKTLEGLRREFLRAKQFFEDKTSSLQFWRKVKDTAAYRATQEKVIAPPAPVEPPKPVTPVPPVQAPPDEPLAGGETVLEDQEDQEDQENPPMPRQVTYTEVQEDGTIVLEDGTVIRVDPETGEILDEYHGSQNRDKYAVDSPEYTKIVGDLWGAVDQLIDMDPAYRDRAFRYTVFDALENEFMSDRDTGVSIEDIKARLEGRMEELHRSRMDQIGAANRRGVSTFFEE